MGALMPNEQGAKTTLAARAKKKCDGWMIAKGWTSKTRGLVWHYSNLLKEQLMAMLPITMLQVLVMAIFFRKSTPTPGLEAAGLISAVVGLVLFLDGLRVAVMPMAMLVGTKLPQKLKLPWVLLVAFCLGVLVTYAEPAIAAIRPLAALVDPNSAPYLYYMMNQQQEIMVFAIGAGVGVAAVIGTLKFLYSISLKILIAVTLAPTVACACYMQWGNRHLQPLMGVAWDCGAVTTGPVTVPVLLSLGVGVMQAQKQKKMALAVLENAALKQGAGSTLEGFGIVTLASLLPVLAVELMAIITSLIHPYEFVLEQAKLAHARSQGVVLPPVEQSPIKEVVYGVRAICPLLIALVFLVVVVLRQPLPFDGFMVDEEEDDEQSEGTEDPSVSGKDPSARGSSSGAAVSGEGSSRGKPVGADDSARGGCEGLDVEAGKLDASITRRAARSHTKHHPPVGREPSLAEAVIAAAGTEDANFYDVNIMLSDSTSYADTASVGGDSVASNRMGKVKSCFEKYGGLMLAMLMCQIGMILFNLGLTYGFAALGDMTGVTLPSAFLAVPYDPKSPYYNFAGGVTIVMLTLFLLGVLATKAEPALNVLGETVETLSSGKFTKKMLIYAVCIGVAAGMCVGATKILFQLPLIYFILAKYVVACGLTVVARESITAVAWDSAGVTTGPVTVPFVLAIGIGFSKAVDASEGFGMLTVMSVAPIISVLAMSLMKQPAKKAAAELARVSKIGIAKVSTALGAGSRGGDGRVIDFASQGPAGNEASNRGIPMERIGEHSAIEAGTSQPAASEPAKP
ncbi:hypothetical protein OEZ85_000714 [Tetradesmus obliquus]|uniref:Cation/H+ exchanger domain-containing protein n=1 Tax=Tetradesmus obliquus TaxID=3088 RepID=A0ABY8UML4_TETOB|nr:hypothetical protein OEZ85_000714 [Tetradesmus obliquus]